MDRSNRHGFVYSVGSVDWPDLHRCYGKAVQHLLKAWSVDQCIDLHGVVADGVPVRWLDRLGTDVGVYGNSTVGSAQLHG
jgi:hypothetical protein